MPQPDEAPADNVPTWMQGEDARADKLADSEQDVTNADAKPPRRRRPKAVNEDRPERSLKGFRIRADYQLRFDELVAREKHDSGMKGPDLIEEALKMLFRKYDKKTIS